MQKSEQLTIYNLIEKAKQVETKEIPKDVKLKKGQSWCPYCNNIVKFIKDKKLNVNKCPFCGISENDFWVKKVNSKKSGR
ncbi:MAG: hypothetical protein WDA24_12325 [Tissierellales bacterium]